MSERKFIATVVVAALVVAGALAQFLRAQERRAIHSAAASAPAPGGPSDRAPIAESVLRALRLVTVEITVGVRSESVDRSWRGDVEASVEAPVRFYYGVDLDDLAGGGAAGAGLTRDPLSGAFRLRVPPPRRLAVEVIGTDERPSVSVDWTRLRGVGGEYHLGLARAGLYASARAARLTPEQRLLVERLTREQLTALLRALLGPDEAVAVEFISDRAREVAGEGPGVSAGGGGEP